MKQFFQKYKKIILSVSVFLVLLTGSILYGVTHLEKTVAVLSKIFLGDPIQIGKIDIQKDKIRLLGISMDLEGAPFIRIPEVNAERLSFASLGEIVIPEAEVYLRRNQEGKFNIDRFIPKDKKEEKKMDLKDYKPVIGIPIAKIVFIKLITHYEDKALKPEFKKMITFQGEVVFDKDKGISAQAEGKDGKELYTLKYSGEKMPYDAYLDVTGLVLNPYLKPYLTSDSVKLDAGKAEAHLHFDYYGNFGDIKAGISSLEFANKKWKNAEAYVLLEGQEVQVGLDYEEEGENKAALLFYDLEKEEAHIELMDLYYDKIILNLEKKKNWNLSFLAESKIYPKLTGTFTWENKDQEFSFTLKSNIIKTKGIYVKEEKTIQLYEKNQFSLSYDIEKQNLREGKGRIPFYIYDYIGRIDFEAKDNQVKFSSLKIFNKDRGSIEAKGSLDITQKKLDLDYNTDHFTWSQKISDNDFLAKLALQGKVNYTEKEGFQASSHGEIEKIQFGKYNIEGLRADVEYKDDSLNVYALENRYLYAAGNLDFKNKNSDLEIEVTDLNSDVLKLDYPKFKIKNAIAVIEGNINNPIVNVSLNESSVFLLKEKENKVKGQLFIENRVLSFQNLEIDQNRISGKYNIADASYNVKANIIEEKLSDYYGFHDLYYRVIGEVLVQGKGRELEAKLTSTLDKIYYQGKKLPDISLMGKYTLGKEGIGQLEFSKVNIQNQKGKKLLSLKGNVNLDSQAVNVDIEKQDLSFEEMQEYTHFDVIKGILSIEGNVRGTYRKPKYQLKVDGRDLKVNSSPLDYFTLDVQGNEEKINVNKIETAYRKSKLQITGYYGITSGSYDISVQSPNIDWSVLQDLVSEYGIKNLSGKSDLNLHLRNINSSGKFQIKNLSFSIPEKYVDVKNLEGNINFLGKEMVIEKIQGKVNDGQVSLQGKVELPELNKIGKNLSFLQDLSYTLNLNADEIKYRIPDTLSLDISSNIRLEENKMRGNIEIIRGLVEDMPNAYQSYWKILKDFFSKKTVTPVTPTETLGNNREAPENTITMQLENLLDLDVSLFIREGIQLNIPTLNVAVEEVQGNITGGLTLAGKQGKYAVLGNIEVEKGSLMVNTNTFVLDKAMVSFNDAKSYLPNVQPSILVDSTVEVNADKVRFSIQGKLNELRFTISSKTGSTSGSLNSLLTGDVKGNEENATYIALLQNLIGGQLTQTVIGPVTKWIRKAFHVERFRVTSNVYNQSSARRDSSEGNLAVGAKMEVRDNIYKDKLYWNFTGNLYDSGGQSTQGRSKDNRVMDEYDLSIQYPYSKTKTFEVGVGKLPSKFYATDEQRDNRKLNYHIGVKIEKKMDDFFDIFKE